MEDRKDGMTLLSESVIPTVTTSGNCQLLSSTTYFACH